MRDCHRGNAELNLRDLSTNKKPLTCARPTLITVFRRGPVWQGQMHSPHSLCTAHHRACKCQTRLWRRRFSSTHLNILDVEELIQAICGVLAAQAAVLDAAEGRHLRSDGRLIHANHAILQALRNLPRPLQVLHSQPSPTSPCSFQEAAFRHNPSLQCSQIHPAVLTDPSNVLEPLNTSCDTPFLEFQSVL